MKRYVKYLLPTGGINKTATIAIEMPLTYNLYNPMDR